MAILKVCDVCKDEVSILCSLRIIKPDDEYPNKMWSTKDYEVCHSCYNRIHSAAYDKLKDIASRANGKFKQ